VDQVIREIFRISESWFDFLDFSIPPCGVFREVSLNCQEKDCLIPIYWMIWMPLAKWKESKIQIENITKTGNL
jgi:hypothetical protein